MLVVRGLAHRACPPVMIFELIKVLGLWKVRQAHTLQVVSSTTFPSALLAPHMGVLERPPSRGGGGNKHLGKRPCGLQPSTQGAAGCLNPGIGRLLPSLPPRRHDFGSLRKDRVGGPQCLTDL